MIALENSRVEQIPDGFYSLKIVLEVTAFCEFVAKRSPDISISIVQSRCSDRMLWEHRRFCASLKDKSLFKQVLLDMLSLRIFDRVFLPRLYDRKSMQLIPCPFLTIENVSGMKKILNMEAFLVEQVFASRKKDDSYVFVPVRNEYISIMIQEHGIIGEIDQFFDSCRNSLVNVRINPSVIGK